MFVGPDINFTYLKLMFLIQISIFPIQNPYFLGRQILTVGARVWRGRALKYRACAQLLTCHFGGGIYSDYSAESDYSPESAETVSSAAAPTLPSSRRGSGLRELHTNSLK